jgi:hypothetical protein
MIVLARLVLLRAFRQGLATAREGRSTPKRRRSRNTPPLARFLILLLLPGNDGYAILRDLDEGSQRIARDKTLGPRYARFWYWFQVLISLLPLAWLAFKRTARALRLYEAIKRVVRS